MEDIIAQIEAEGLAWAMGTSPTPGFRFARVAKDYATAETGGLNKVGRYVGHISMTAAHTLSMAHADYRSKFPKKG